MAKNEFKANVNSVAVGGRVTTMSSTNLGPLQNQLLRIAKQVISKPKEERQSIIIQMTEIMRNLSPDQLIAVINQIEDEASLRYMTAAGVPGDAFRALQARRQMLGKVQK